MVEVEVKKEEPVKPEVGAMAANSIKDAPAELSVLERVEAANKKAEELMREQKETLKKNEDAVATLVLGGRSYAGQSSIKPVESEDEKWAKDAKKRYEGTGLDPTPSKKDGA